MNTNVGAIYIWVINLIYEANGLEFIGLCIRRFYPNLSDTTLVDTYQIEYKFIRQNPTINYDSTTI
jgi:hypothetical protein